MNVNTNFSVIKIIIKNDSKPSSSINSKKEKPQHKNFKIFSLIKKSLQQKKISSVWTTIKKPKCRKKSEKSFFLPTTLIIILLMMHYSSYVLYDMKKNKKGKK